MSIVYISLFLINTSSARAQNIENMLERLTSQGDVYAAQSLKRIYEQKQNSRLWNNDQIQELISAIKQSDLHGLTPENYHLAELRSTTTDATIKDVLASDAYLTLAGHLLGGKLNPVSLEPTWTAKGREKDLVIYLQEALTKKNNIEHSLQALAPNQIRYKLFQESLQRYREIEEAGSWGVVSSGELLKLGVKDPRVAALRARLAATKDIEVISADEELFDDTLQLAVKAFQHRVNLEPDGVVGPATLKQLNLTVKDRIDQLRINMERWRWLPEDMGEKHVRVNIANFQMEAFEGTNVVKVYDVIVGKDYRQTPIFSESMKYLVLNPWWETPDSLARKDILPKFQQNAVLVEELGYQVLDKERNIVNSQQINWQEYSAKNFPFRVRQAPGKNNALGRVKFMFPNVHNVYLHDTPTPELFSRTRRDFSSGCIRVKDPIALAEWVLNDNPEWPRSKIDESLTGNKDKSISLKKPMQVHLLYLTVVVDEMTNDIRFINDIYQRDNRVLAALNSQPDNE